MLVLLLSQIAKSKLITFLKSTSELRIRKFASDLIVISSSCAKFHLKIEKSLLVLKKNISLQECHKRKKNGILMILRRPVQPTYKVKIHQKILSCLKQICRS